MIKIIFQYFLLILGITLISYDSFFNAVYYKVLGLALTMFVVYKLQHKIPSKTNNDENQIEDE